MATKEELESVLNDMSDDEFLEFTKKADRPERIRSAIVNQFVLKPELERIFCLRLGLKTEAEKINEAIYISAKSSASSALSARCSMILASLATIISIISLVLSICI